MSNSNENWWTKTKQRKGVCLPDYGQGPIKLTLRNQGGISLDILMNGAR